MQLCKNVVFISVLVVMLSLYGCVPVAKMTKKKYNTETRVVVRKSEYSVELLDRQLKGNKLSYVFKFMKRDYKVKQQRNYYRDAFKQWVSPWNHRGSYYTEWINDAHTYVALKLPETTYLIEGENVETDDNGILRVVIKLGKKIEEYTYVDCVTFSYEDWTYQDCLR